MVGGMLWSTELLCAWAVPIPDTLGRLSLAWNCCCWTCCWDGGMTMTWFFSPIFERIDMSFRMVLLVVGWISRDGTFEFCDWYEVSFRFFNSVLAVMLLMQLWLMFWLLTVNCASEILIAEFGAPEVEVLPWVRLFLDREILLIFNGCSTCWPE